MNRLSRLTSILTQLQAKRIVTATELSKKYDVSVRTIYRDIRSLEDSGIPIYTEEGKGYSLVEGYTLPPVMFTEEEANALITGYSIVSRNKDASLVDNYKDAITKIKSVLRTTEKGKAELLTSRVAYINNLSQITTSNILSSIQIAITSLRLIDISYISLYKNEESSRLVEPQAMYHTQGNWILIAWCRLRNDYREFRLDRIQSIKMRGDHFEDRKFDLMIYFKEQVEQSKSKNS